MNKSSYVPRQPSNLGGMRPEVRDDKEMLLRGIKFQRAEIMALEKTLTEKKSKLKADEEKRNEYRKLCKKCDSCTACLG